MDGGPRPQFITWHLADGLPREVVAKWIEELRARPSAARRRELYSRIEKYLDAGHGSSILADSRASRIEQDALLHGHYRSYRLHRWAIMPNHVHLLLTPLPGKALGDILRDHKGYTSRTINKALRRSGQLWQEDFYDRFIRDQAHHERVAAYIEWNPVKAGLCADPSLWQYSSANEDSYERLLRIERERGRED